MESTEVFNSYWRFAAERQAIYFRRLAGSVGPWTSDVVLSRYRFTNVYRASDRVSQYLIREVQYHPDRIANPRELFFRTMLFKIFNRIETWQMLEEHVGPLSWQRTDLSRVCEIMDRHTACGERLYSAAYIMPSPTFGHARKHANHLALLERMMADGMPELVAGARSLSAVYELLKRYPGIGPFLAFQYAIDLNYSEMLCHDESDFVVAGPGAVDGISKCFSSTSGRSAEEVIYWTCEQQDRAFSAAGLNFQSLFGRKLQPIDCQNLFCEISKYARIVHPEVGGISGRTRIKQIYRGGTGPLAKPMFPLRWALRVKIGDAGLSSGRSGELFG